MKEYRPAKKRITISVGESVRILRELQELSQNQLARSPGFRMLPFQPLKMIVPDWVSSGQKFWPRRLLKCHPSILAPAGNFPTKLRHLQSANAIGVTLIYRGHE